MYIEVLVCAAPREGCIPWTMAQMVQGARDVVNVRVLITYIVYREAIFWALVFRRLLEYIIDKWRCADED